MTIGEAVGERILKLCKDRNLTVNNPASCSLAGGHQRDSER